MQKLRFFPDMSITEAARIAHSAGMELRVAWEGDRPIVEAVRPYEEDWVPAFLRRQCDPSGGADTEKVVSINHFSRG